VMPIRSRWQPSEMKLWRSRHPSMSWKSKSPPFTQICHMSYMQLTEVKIKSLSFFFFNWEPSHEGISGKWRYSSMHSLTLALDGGEWSASHPGRFNPRKNVLGTHWIGGWVGHRTILDAVMRKMPSSHQESTVEPQLSIP
jgi:hypothetical protein